MRQKFDSISASNDDSINDIIGRALNRKTISNAYHSEYPRFLKSQGPFKIYNHYEVKGQDHVENISRAKQEAVRRFHNELDKITNLREEQKKAFRDNISQQN